MSSDSDRPVPPHRPADRPLSPHLQIYRWQVSMFTSIMHRMTGVALSVGSLFLVAWLIAAAAGPDAFASVNGIAASWYGQILMFFWSLALFYHLCNGVRHLAWDMGIGLDLETVKVTGNVVVGAAVALTIIVWLWAWIG